MAFSIHEDITQAHTLPADFYLSEDTYHQSVEQVFARTWHFIGHQSEYPANLNVFPVKLYPGFMEEPMVLTRGEQGLQCLSNVCTHRGNLLMSVPGQHRQLICGYHGRRFALNGQMTHMPEFKEVKDFPAACDHLAQYPLHDWRGFLFTAPDPAFPFAEISEVLDRKCGFLPWEEARFDAEHSKDYIVQAHWALYCDNYLEGFHIPFVHPGLNAALDYGSYATELYPYLNLQVGLAGGDTLAFEMPTDHEDAGKSVAAYYFWVFPNMMWNVYPWGVSVNVVKPLSPTRTRVSFLSYVWDESKREGSAGEELDKVEREDEAVVESVQKGLRSRHYHRGRYSPTREQGVHHFHRLLDRFMNP